MLGALGGGVLGVLRGHVLRAVRGDSVGCLRVGCRFALLVATLRSTDKSNAKKQNKKSPHALIADSFAPQGRSELDGLTS